MHQSGSKCTHTYRHISLLSFPPEEINWRFSLSTPLPPFLNCTRWTKCTAILKCKDNIWAELLLSPKHNLPKYCHGLLSPDFLARNLQVDFECRLCFRDPIFVILVIRYYPLPLAGVEPRTFQDLKHRAQPESLLKITPAWDQRCKLCLA